MADTSNILAELKKIKYHLSLVAETINSDSHPIQHLVIAYDWTEDDLDKAHDIFEKFDNQIDNQQSNINWADFEKQFNDNLNLNYQRLKHVVLAFYDNHQWVSVCEAYAKAYPCMEFHRIFKQ